MAQDVTPTRIGSDDIWHEIEALIGEAARFAQSEMSASEFYAELLRRLRLATGADACAAWTRGSDERLTVAYDAGVSGLFSPGDNVLAARVRAVQDTGRSREPRILTPRASHGRLLENPSDRNWLLQPIVVGDEVQGVLELFYDADAAPEELRGVGQVIAAFADVAREFHTQTQLRELQSREGSWSELDRFAQQVHRSLDVDEVGYAIANEAVRLLGVDRVSVLRRTGKPCQLVAISGVASPSRRSHPVRTLERLAQAVAASGEPLWYSGADETLPPELQERLQEYLDSASVRTVAVLPLQSTAKSLEAANEDHRADDRAWQVPVVGLLVCERFEATPWSEGQRHRIEVLGRHAASALGNAVEVDSLPLIGLSRAIRRGLAWCGSWRPSRVLLWLLLVAGLISLGFVPVDFTIVAEGRLQPVERRHVFAPDDGTVEEVLVDHGDQVTRGQTLVAMRQTGLDYELARVLGELQTQQRRLDAVRSSRLQHPRGLPSQAFDDLTAEEERLKTLLASLEAQRNVLVRQQQELNVRSPLDGQVLTWNTTESLPGRPVRRGQRLLTVANPSGPWQLELYIRDHDVQHVLAAREAKPALPVRFVLGSHAGQPCSGAVDKVAMSTELDEEQRPAVLVTVALDKSQLPELRPGAKAFARIDCGRRAAAFVWFRELWEVIQTRWLT